MPTESELKGYATSLSPTNRGILRKILAETEAADRDESAKVHREALEAMGFRVVPAGAKTGTRTRLTDDQKANVNDALRAAFVQPGNPNGMPWSDYVSRANTILGAGNTVPETASIWGETRETFKAKGFIRSNGKVGRAALWGSTDKGMKAKAWKPSDPTAPTAVPIPANVPGKVSKV